MEYVEAVRRNRLVAFLVVLAVLVPTVLANVLAPPQYTAATRLWVGVGGGTGISDLSQKVSVAADLMNTYPELVRSPLVLSPVISKLGLAMDAQELSDRVEATVPNDTLVLDIQVTDENPERAAAIANAVAEQYGTVVGALPQVRTSAAEAVHATVLEPAVAPPRPSSPQVARNIGIALVLGLVLAIVVCLVVARYPPEGRAKASSVSSDGVPEQN
jgi:succinoglycan biosynthesis transport protein ExoP